MNKCHQNINWQNDTTPAINETNLNYMDGCIDTIDDRVVALANDPPANALKAEGWAIGEQSGVPVTSDSPYYENNSKYYSQESANEVLKSEGFANGTQGGVPVTSGSPYYENNAKYWKEQAQAIAGNSFSGLSDVNFVNLQDGQVPVYDATNQEWVNGDAGSQTTNPNILINPWFTVNQRGITSATLPDTNTKLMDMWECARITYSLTSSGFSLAWNGVNSTHGFMLQKIEGHTELNGKTLTFSAIIDGNIITKTFTLSSGAQTITLTSNLELYVNGDFTNGNHQFRLRNYSTTAVIVRAIKVEVGSSSTLHLDPAPDYTTELLKCQRYLYVVGGTSGYSSLFVGSGDGSTTIQIAIDLPVPLRTTPIISTTGSFRLIGEGSQIAVTSISAHYTLGNKLFLNVTASSSLSLSKLYMLARQTDCEIRASAEL